MRSFAIYVDGTNRETLVLDSSVPTVGTMITYRGTQYQLDKIEWDIDYNRHSLFLKSLKG